MFHHLNVNHLNRLAKSKNTFILLDSALPAQKKSMSYLFIDPVNVLCANTFDDVPALLGDVDKYSKDYWVCGYLSYEAAYALENRFEGFKGDNNVKQLPLGWFGVFRKPYIYNHSNGNWDRKPPLLQNHTENTVGLPQPLHTMDRDNYERKIRSIKNLIAKGETYQVNFTYDTIINSKLDAFAVYSSLRKSQPTKYCSFIKNEYGNVLSFSPELFFEKNNRKISVKPMKGTAARGISVDEDKCVINTLASDKKNSAENVMIVDLLRNDLGRVCEKNSIKAQKLFEVETHPTLHQMTSTITGNLRPGIEFESIVRNLFPCGSVTGAPKIRTMEIIRSLEEGPRGVYCGMLGYVSPAGRAVFNVPIRTLQKSNSEKTWRYRVGSGVVWNSSALSERKECLTKCSFLNQPNFDIFETILWNGKLVYFEDHIKRLRESSKYFGYTFSLAGLNQVKRQIYTKLKGIKNQRVRILLDSSGVLRWECAPLDANSSVKVLVSRIPVDEKNVFLYHKTTNRKHYDKYKKRGYFDSILINSKGQVTEGTISNVFIKKGKMLYTPPVKCGLLPGVLRKQLIKQKKCKEKVLRVDDLYKAEKVYCGNSVRGLVEVELVDKIPLQI